MNILKTPEQILLEQAGIMPKYAQGGSTGEEISPEQMLAILLAHGYEPQHFVDGGFVPQYNPDAVAQPIQQTPTEWVSEKVGDVIGQKPADRLFGTGEEGHKSEYLPLQLLNPAYLATSTADSAKEFYDAATRGDYGDALKSYYLGLMNVLPATKGAKKAVGPVLSKLKNLIP
jgi:hypothetical protein